MNTAAVIYPVELVRLAYTAQPVMMNSAKAPWKPTKAEREASVGEPTLSSDRSALYTSELPNEFDASGILFKEEGGQSVVVMTKERYEALIHEIEDLREENNIAETEVSDISSCYWLSTSAFSYDWDDMPDDWMADEGDNVIPAR
jgi:PHD/YefM family antitoxin component YafN of YafNO toxin-antitoxin module